MTTERTLEEHPLIGRRFGMLTVLRRGGTSARRRALLLCKCDCGREVIAESDAVRRLVSCGRHMKELLTKHGEAKRGHLASGAYHSWLNMQRRCLTPSTKAYGHYGGRGIMICGRWGDFRNFLVDMGERPPGTSLGRRNNDGDYTPENCRWETRAQQSTNHRRADMCRQIALWAMELRLKGVSIEKIPQRFGFSRNAIYRGQKLHGQWAKEYLANIQ